MCAAFIKESILDARFFPCTAYYLLLPTAYRCCTLIFEGFVTTIEKYMLYQILSKPAACPVVFIVQ
jgi:hypothetical protein